MNVLFLTMSRVTDVDSHGIYEDLIRELARNGHRVCIVSPTERRFGKDTYIIENKDAADWHKSITILKVKTGNLQKTNLLEKGISTILVESQFKAAIKKYFNDIKFDLVLYSTPPITLLGVIEYVKKRDNAVTYLMLKDIFPQNAVDIGMLSKSGIKGIIYLYFRRQEKQLYAASDRIGCMSPANVDYLIKHNAELNADKIEVCPNCFEVDNFSFSEEEKRSLREKYSIPLDKKIFVYGGNIGRPQGIPFIIECLKAEKNNKDVFFFIVGDGTEYGKLEAFINEEKTENAMLIKKLPKKDFDSMLYACDAGLIFLDYRFTIPNFPSRLLSYIQASLPVIAAVDSNTDVGKIIAEGGFGFSCESNNAENFLETVKKALSSDLKSMGEKGREYLINNYTSEHCYNIIESAYRKLRR